MNVLGAAKPLPHITDPRISMEGVLITARDLPKFDEIKRWVASKKAIIALAVKAGLITAQEASARYHVSSEELNNWTTLLDRYGPKGLRLLHQREGMSLEEAGQNMVEAQQMGVLPQNFSMGVLSADLQTEQVSVDGNLLSLTSSEYRLLKCLILNEMREPGTICSRNRLLEMLYSKRSVEEIPHKKIIDVMFSKLRKKLGAASEYIETVWGRGYALREPLT